MQERKNWRPDRPKPKRKRPQKKRATKKFHDNWSLDGNCSSGGSSLLTSMILELPGTSKQPENTEITSSSANNLSFTDTDIEDYSRVTVSRPYRQLQKPQRVPYSTVMLHSTTDDERIPASSDSSIDHLNTKGSSASKAQTFQNDFLATVESPNMLCPLCNARPKNATLVHGRITHQVCCYPCAKKLFKSRMGCPACKRKIEKITKNII